MEGIGNTPEIERDSVTHVIYVLFAFIGIGLFSDRLGKKWSFVLMALVIGVYVIYTFRTHNMSAV